MEVLKALYIYTAILKFLTHVEYLSNRGVSEKKVSFSSKKYYIYI